MANQHTQSYFEQKNYKGALARIAREIERCHVTYEEVDRALIEDCRDRYGHERGYHSFGAHKTQSWPIEEHVAYRLISFGTAHGDGSVKVATKLAVEFIHKIKPSALDRLARET